MKKRTLFSVVGMICLGFVIAVLPFGAVQAKPITLTISNYFPPPSGQSKIMVQFIEELEARTGGQVKVRYFPGGSLLKAPATIKGVEKGIADIGLAHIEYTAGRFPVMEACELPLGFATGWVANQMMNEFYNKFMPKELDKFKILWWHANSPSVLITKKPVRSIEDLKGMTIRAPGLMGDIIKAMGATAAPTSIMETYDAISKGVVDGVFTPFETLRTFKFGEVAKYVTVASPIGTSYPFFIAMTKKKYESLPADVRVTLDLLAGQYRERMALMWNAVEFPGKAFGERMGVEYIEISGAEEAKFQAAADRVVENYVQKMMGQGFAEAEIREWLTYLKDRSAEMLELQKFYQIKSVVGPPEVR
ncbi:TRAP transporter substrate-binding protein [Desulfobacula sp.]|uniref:TRAP transporter substrate-binding protein n=1 Tax=Desulfobacula sp. TaxID=2593537 RepID=UPI002636CB3E|nr:TRAP transporter substrate-binding protein [Desulfobacula sp.]